MITETGVDIQHAAKLLKSGKLVAIPTETVYGLAGNALDENSVLNIFKLKNRPSFDPLIVHLGDVRMVEKYVTEIPSAARKLMDRFWPGPLTILFHKKDIIPDLVTSGLDNVAIRIPDHSLTLQLLNQLDFPLAAPSANPFGYISPTSVQHVAKHFTGAIPYILDGGPCKVGIESTIVGFENGNCIVYRFGGISLEELESQIGKLMVRNESLSTFNVPGMLKSHYAPKTPLYFGAPDELLKKYPADKVAVICLQKSEISFPEGYKIFELSPQGNLEEAAMYLFSTMRQLDLMNLDCIYAEMFPETGLGIAINDRLKKASVNN